MTKRPVFVFPLVVAFMASSPAEARDRYQAYCSIGSGRGETHQYVAVTEVFETDLSVDEITYQMESFISDIKKGRVQVAFNTTGALSAYCVPGGPVPRQNHFNFYLPRGHGMMSIKSPLDYRGYYRRNSTASAIASTKPRAPVATKPVPALSPPASKGLTPNQLKYQRELAEHQARLAEIDRIKATNAAKHAADQATAAAELARHQRERASADAAKRKYEADLAAHQRLVDQMQSNHDRERKVDWREAVVVCMLNANDGQSRFGNWRCDGPLQMTYAKLGSAGTAPDPQAIISLSQACGGSKEAVRDLGMVGAAHLFGCSFGLHPKSTSGFPSDAAAKHGISFVPGRATYRCPEWKSACRTQ